MPGLPAGPVRGDSRRGDAAAITGRGQRGVERGGGHVNGDAHQVELKRAQHRQVALALTDEVGRDGGSPSVHAHEASVVVTELAVNTPLTKVPRGVTTGGEPAATPPGGPFGRAATGRSRPEAPGHPSDVGAVVAGGTR